MSWRTGALVLIAIFAVVAVQAVLADPLVSVGSEINGTGDYSDNGAFDGNDLLTDLPNAFFNSGLILIFGAMGWGVARVIKDELTRKQL